MTGDDPLWKAYRATTKPLLSVKKRVRPPLRTSVPRVVQPKSSLPVSFSETRPLQPIALDRRKEQNMRDGALELDGRLDLHGKTQDEAYHALARFMAAQWKFGHRQLLIITGKGREGQGTLRSNLPVWLATLPEAAHILALRPAAAKHGGDGACYVLMRKDKNNKRV